MTMPPIPGLPASRFIPILGLAALLVAGVPDALGQVGDPISQARQALNDDRFAEAVSILTVALAQDPDNAEMLVLRGQAHEARRQYQEAIADYERALTLRPNHAAAEGGLERARRLAGATAGTPVEAHRRQVEANPANLTYRLQYADALRDAGQLPEAARQYEVYLSRTQGTPDVVTRYLIVLASMGQHVRGASEAMRFLGLYPGSADLWMRLGYFRLWKGQHSAAEEAFQRALSHDPRNVDAQRGLAEARQSLQAGTHTAPPGHAVIERLQSQLAAAPDRADLRFELVDELMTQNRPIEAFSELQALEPQHSQSPMWRDRFERVDRALPEDAEVYQIDRLTYRLALDPANLETRYALVNAMAEANRYGEAYYVLLDGGRFAGADNVRYQERLRRLQEERLAFARRQQEILSARLDADATDMAAARGLAATYPLLQANGDLDTDFAEARVLFERLLRERPDDAEVRFQYAQLLTQGRATEAAIHQSRMLLELDPDDPHYIAQYVYAAIQKQPPPADTEQILLRGLRNHPDHPSLLLAAVTYYTSMAYDDPDLLQHADRYLLQAEAAGADTRDVVARREAIADARNYRILLDARAAATEGRYHDAVAGIESYYRITGIEMPREARVEIAHYLDSAGDGPAALTLLEEAQQESFSIEDQRAIARLRFDAGDYSGALAAIEPVLARDPQHGPALLLYGDALRELGRYDEAEAAYQGALITDDTMARLDAEDRLIFLDQITAFDTPFGAIISPRINFVWAGGDGIEYQRISPGLEAQMTVPDVPVTATAGYQAHRISGTDLVIPGIARHIPSYTAHQLGAGLIVDLTPHDRALSYTENYTNRIQAEAGIIHYPSYADALTGESESRTAPFWSARFLHQRPGSHRASIGVRQTEGSKAVWAAIGPSIGLSVIQADIQGSAAPLDSLLKVSGRIAGNRVTHEGATFAFGRLESFTGETIVNHGYTIDLMIGYRLAEGLYFGGMYNRIEYDQPSPFYYAPAQQPQELFEAFLEFETGGRGQRPYFRVLGALGTVAYAGGYLTRRIEADLIYPVSADLGFGANLRASQYARAFPDGEFSSYSILVVGAALYLGL